MSIGGGPIFQVEARAVIEGLQLAWNKEFWKLELECDNTLLVEIILTGGAADSRLMELQLIHHVHIQSWEVRVRHIPLVQNTVANLLAKIEDPELLRFHLLEELPPFVWELLMADSNPSILS
ncbi:hypothetical protein PVK06_009869 [Gossypium arboreum]|uniref:RNase H type-1 domain-containing protein n=1 Tax=Gossypium arboreum TaxID=29729 RepID=A0ABR0QNR1_GOSAR|nr:hypothetical protein PVK06_009869 [Gossypium arboreum]